MRKIFISVRERNCMKGKCFLYTITGDGMMMSSTKKWWLLKNGKILYYGGTLSFVVYVILLPVLLLYLYGKVEMPSVVLCVAALLILVFLLTIHFGYGYVCLYKVIGKLPPQLVVEDFHPVRGTITLKDERARRFHIMFRRFWGKSEKEPERYEVWTPLRRSTRYPEDSLRGFWWVRYYFRPVSTVFDENVSRLIPHVIKKVKVSSYVTFIGLARERGNPVLFAMVSKKADSATMNRVITLLGTLRPEIE